MPVVAPKRSTKKKKKSLFDRLAGAGRSTARFYGRAARDAEDIVTGTPTGVVMTLKALDQALPASPIPGIDDHHVRDSAAFKEIARQSALQMKEDLRHPLRNPVSTALTVGGLFSLGSGTAARGVAATSALRAGRGVGAAAKAAARPKLPVRTVTGIKKPDPVVGRRYKSEGRWVETRPQVTGRKSYEMVANKNPLVRGARKITLDKAYARSAAKAERNLANPRLIEGAKVLEHGSKEYKALLADTKIKTPTGIVNAARSAGYDAISRGNRLQVVNKKALAPKQPRGGKYARMVERRTLDQRKRYGDQLRSATNPVEKSIAPNKIRDVYRLPLDILRMGMYVRPRYYVQNLGGTATLLAHAGISAGDVRKVRQIAKTDPELYSLMIGAGGETATRSISLGEQSSGKVGRLQHRMSEKANRPEAHMRTIGVWKAATELGVDTPAQLKKVLSKPDSNLAQLIMQRANESLVDYSRVGGSGNFGKAEAAFVRSGLPIFYPMTKGFTRYAARFPGEHPFQASLIGALGQEGREAQREGLGGQPQPWFPYLTPTGKDETINLQNIFWGSPGGDIARQAAQTLPGAKRHPTLNLFQNFGPTADLIYGGLTGRQLATGFEYDKDTLDTWGDLLTALGDTAASAIPFADLVHPRASKAFGTPDLEDRLKLWAVGPGLIKRKTDLRSAVEKPKKKKRRKTSSRY